MCLSSLSTYTPVKECLHKSSFPKKQSPKMCYLREKLEVKWERIHRRETLFSLAQKILSQHSFSGTLTLPYTLNFKMGRIERNLLEGGLGGFKQCSNTTHCLLDTWRDLNKKSMPNTICTRDHCSYLFQQTQLYSMPSSVIQAQQIPLATTARVLKRLRSQKKALILQRSAEDSFYLRTHNST